MIDALGNPQSLLLLGGTSDIALATARRLAGERLRRVVLAARPGPGRDAAADRLREAGIAEVTAVDLEATDPATHEASITECFAGGDVDVALVAFGLLGDQQRAERDVDHAVEVATVNYVGALSVGLRVAQRLRSQGHGTLVVLSSVAGERARRSNFVYGSTKAGLDALAQGLGDALHGSGARVLVVRPGFVRSKMTAGLAAAPFATTPEAVAEAIVTGVRRRSDTVWVPSVLRPVMFGIRHLPRPLMRRLPL